MANNASKITNMGGEVVILPPPHATGFTIAMARAFAQRNESNRVWRQFKKKWDGRIPRRGSVRFNEFAKDANTAHASIQVLFDEVRNG